MNTVSITVDGREISASPNTRLVDVLDSAGIVIPHLCYFKGLTPYAGCRTCVVEIQGVRGISMACTTLISPGMVINTHGEGIDELRQAAVELINADHPGRCLDCHRVEHCRQTFVCLRDSIVTDRCLTCAKNQFCELQTVSELVGMAGQQRYYDEPSSWYKGHEEVPLRRHNPFIELDFNKCIICARCVRVCDEVRGKGIYTLSFRGPEAKIDTHFGKDLGETDCEFDGACIDACPVAAIMDKPSKWLGLPQGESTTTCGYCGVGCQMVVQSKRNRIIRILGDFSTENTANRGQLCVKGRYGFGFVQSQERLTTPLIRRDGQLSPATWEEVLGLVAHRLAEYQGSQCAMLTSSHLTNEDSYVAQKFARVVMATNNIDNYDRVAPLPSQDPLAQAFGLGATTNPIADIGEAGCIFVIGSDARISHPILGIEIERAVRYKDAQLIVAHHRPTELQRLAQLSLYYRPGTEAMLLGAMLKVIFTEELANEAFLRDHSEGLAELIASLDKLDLETAVRVTGVTADKIAAAARLYAATGPAIIISPHKGSNGRYEHLGAIANLALLTGNLGKPGAGVTLLQETNNGQGALDLGCVPDTLPGYRKVDQVADRAQLELAWGVSLPQEAGLAAQEVGKAIREETIKALYVVGVDLLKDDVDSENMPVTLQGLEFLVVQDITLTPTARMAHVVLPALAVQEQEGTFTNIERRVQMVRRTIEPPPEARADWWILAEIARQLGVKGFSYDSSALVMEEIAKITPLYGGLSHSRLANGGLLWPCPTSDHSGTPRLYEEALLLGRGRFQPLELAELSTITSPEQPLMLTVEQFISRPRAGGLTDAVDSWLAIAPQDALSAGLSEGAMAQVSLNGHLVQARSRVREDWPIGQPTLYLQHPEALTASLTDPILRQQGLLPAITVASARINPVNSEAKEL